MTVLVVGGGGFIGSSVVNSLLMGKYSVRILEREGLKIDAAQRSHGEIEWVFGDYRDSSCLEKALAGIDSIVFLSWSSSPKSSSQDPVGDATSNLIGTLQFLEASVKHGIKKIVFSSSGGTVYGEPEYLPIDEFHPTNPIVPYGVSKLAVEKYLDCYRRQHGIESIVLRISNPFGERQRMTGSQGAIGIFIRQALMGEPVSILGDGSSERDYIYVSDVGSAFVKALEYVGSQTLFNLGSGKGSTLNEILDLIESYVGAKIERNHIDARAFDVSQSILDNTRIISELKWSPTVTLSEGIRRTVQWQRNLLEG